MNLDNTMTLNLIAYYREEQQVFDLRQGRQTLGRSQKTEITLDQKWTLVSNSHMILEVDGNWNVKIIDGSNGIPSTNGTQLNNTFISSEEWSLVQLDDELKIGNDSRESVKLKIVDPSQSQNAQSNFTLDNDEDITIGRSEDCTIVIQCPTVSRIHAVIRKRAGKAILIDNSKNGIFVNGQTRSRSTEITNGDEVKIGTYVFLWNKGRLVRETTGKNYRVDVNNVFLKGRISGSSLSIEPGQLVAFVGGSGAGKSSFLTTIVGHNMDYSGSIKINGSELRESYNSIKQEIGFVPQDDIVHMDLTVEEVLRFSARLKLPDPESQRTAVEKTLKELEIQHRRKAKIRDLSGGQRKRVSIGVELLADPRILFLDEPTSGLDPGLDKRMMQLLRNLADSGRTVALVTHATNNVMLCDQVAFLGRGGYLCYAGPPQNCNSYFNVSGDFSDVYQRLEVPDQEIKQLAENFKRVQISRQQLSNVINPNSFVSNQKSKFIRFNDLFSQLKTMVSRELIIQSRDLTSIFLNALTAPIAAIMLAVAVNNRLIFSNHNASLLTPFLDAQRILFVIVCSSIWVGLSSSLQAIVKERAIFKRERAFNLLPEAYLLGKVIVMFATSLLQAVLLAITVNILFESPPGIDSEWTILIGLGVFVTLLAVGSQALFVSSIVKNSQQASSIAPLLLIPQLVFGGVLFHLSDSAEGIYSVITSRWSMILVACWSEITEIIPKLSDGSVNLLSIEGASAYENISSNTSEALLYLGGQFLFFSIATLFSLLFFKKNRQ